jgi:hypothetical protein
MDWRRFLADLERVFLRKDASGTRIYSEDETRAYLFRLFLDLGPDAFGPEGPSPAALLLVGEYSIRIGLGPDQSIEEMKAAVDRYYREHPIRADLRAEVHQVLRDGLSGVYADLRAAHRVLGVRSPLALPARGRRTA